MRRALAVLALIALLCLSTLAQAAITIETVLVGDPGNAADTEVMNDGTTGYGSVGYEYRIGKYEVTAGQYTAFLNAVAATDTYSLYNTLMARTDDGSGITRSGSSGSYTYSVATDFVNRPISLVNFWDSVRFANWLHNGQPIGLQNVSTTEDGAYAINGYNGYRGEWIVRKPVARWFIPSENEWYKAAYYKGHGTNAGYWDYPTRSNTAPGRDLNDASGNNANYYGDPYPIDNGKMTTLAGGFRNSASPYGTFDQGGNVWEYNEAIHHQNFYYAYRGGRGGSYVNSEGDLRASVRGYGSAGPAYETVGVGFRVAAVPEPSSITILAGGLLALATGLRRRR